MLYSGFLIYVVLESVVKFETVWPLLCLQTNLVNSLVKSNVIASPSYNLL